MAKEVTTILKLNIKGGAASPQPPVGPALGQAGINIMEFCKAFNDQTKDKKGDIVPVVITVYKDRSFTFITKTPPASSLILKEAKLQKGSGEPNTKKVGSITKDQVKKIAEIKMPDLNARDIEQAMKIVEGTARSMGIEIK